MGRLNFSFVNNGITIPLTNVLPVGALKEIGAQGFGLAPTTLQIITGASGAGRHRSTRRGPRDIDLPIVFQDVNADGLERQMRQFVAMLNDRYSAPKMIAEYPDKRKFEIEIHYASGADPQHGVDTNGTTWARWPLTLRAPNPYWVAQTPVPYSLRTSNAQRGLIRSGGSLSMLRLSSSQTLGKITVENDGDVDAQPVWTLRGPGGTFSATRPDGAAFSFFNLGSDTITVDTTTKKVTDATGANRYTSLSSAPKLFSIPPGVTTLEVLLTDTTPDSLISMNFRPRREFVF